MSIHRNLAAIAIAGVLVSIPQSSAMAAQDPNKGRLANVRSMKCSFSLMAAGTWGSEQPDARTKPVKLTLQFDSINTDEGTARMDSVYGSKYDIIVRYANGYLHFIQSFLDGPLHTTTILEKKTAGGKWKAMHSRHEYMDIALPGFTSSPEQYYGECDIIN